MASREKTSERGRIRITGFDTAAVTERDELVEWKAAETAESGTSQRAKSWHRFKQNRSAFIGIGILAFMVFVAVFSRPIEVAVAGQTIPVQPFELIPHSTDTNLVSGNAPPSMEHPFGTGQLGRDILSQVMVGARYSLAIGVIAVGLAVLVGVPMGAIAGYYGGWIDEAIMRLVDILYAFPFLVLAIVIIAILGQGFWKMIAALVIVGWIGYARLIRGEILSVKENEYVMAAKALGARDRSIIFKHIVPNAMAPVIVQATLNVGTIVLAAAALGFLGLGLQPGTPEWGTILSEGRDAVISGRWWVTVFPGLAIVFFVLAVNLVGDGVRDALDPQDAGGDGGGGGFR
ncbi:MAG: peptide/nickel transport system permease protein [Natronomonas sp.]|jgi:peptide/nickel transport system permease protein|uniref:ABC transporter permease n=1 Tax=Natronomonas sp. TaxID=2184060 RepID=UPI003988A1AC